MKKSELKQLIKESIRQILKEEISDVENEKYNWKNIVNKSGEILRLIQGNDIISIYHHFYPRVPKGKVIFSAKINGRFLMSNNYPLSVVSDESKYEETLNKFKNQVETLI